jgi:CBS domain-containing protein
MFVREAMTERALWITPDITLIEAARKMRDESIGCLPIGENDRLIGMITDRDLACRAVAEGADPAKTKVRDVMTRGIVYCFEADDLAATIEQMDKKRIHHMPVLNERKRIIGILSLSDLALNAPLDLSREVFRLASRDASAHARAGHA